MAQRPRGVSHRVLEAVTGPFSLGVEYMKFWTGYGLSGVADNVGATALSIILLQKTGSAVAVSLGLMLQLLPAAMVGPFAGLMLDRLNRKAVMAVASALKALATAYVALSIQQGAFGLVQCAVWMGVTSIIKAFYDPCSGTLLPSVVSRESLQRANAMQALANNTAMILGPALAGFGLATAGRAFTMTACALSFACGSISLAMVNPKYEAPVRQPGKPGFGEILEGLRFFREVPLAMHLLVAIVLVNFLAVPSYTAFEVHVLGTLGADPGALGYAFSVSAVASLVAAYLVALRKRWPHLGRMMMTGAAAMGASFVLTGISRSVTGVVWAFALFGAAGPLLLIPVGALFQEITPTGIRGRVFASRFVVVTLAAPLTTPLAGWGLDRLGSRPVLLLLGSLMGLIAVLGLSSKVLRDA